MNLSTKLQIAQTALLSLGCILLSVICIRGTTHQTKDAAQAQQLADMLHVRNGIRQEAWLVNDEPPAMADDYRKFTDAMNRCAGNLTASIGRTRTPSAP